MTLASSETDVIKHGNVITYGNLKTFRDTSEKIIEQEHRLTCLNVQTFCLVFTTVLIYVFSIGFGYCLSVLYPEFIRVFSSKSSDAALIQNLFTAFNLGGVILWNPLAGRFGQGVCVILGSCLVVAGVFLAQFATSIWVLILCIGVIAGVGASITSFGPNVLINDIFVKWKQAAFAAIYTGPSIGQFCFPYFIECLLEQYNWNGTLLVMSAFMANLIPCGIIIYYIEKDTISSKPFAESSSGGKLFDSCVFKEWRLYPLLINGLLIAFSVFVESNFLVDHMILKGYGRATGALFLSYMGLANLAGRIVTLTSKIIFHSGNCLIQITIFTMMIAASHAVILFTGSYFGILVGAILNGFSLGLFFPQIPVILLEIYPSELYGAIYSVWNIFLGVGFCLGGYFGGFIRDISSSYDLLFELAIICNSIMAVNFFISGVSCRKICKKLCKNNSIDG